MPAILKTEYAPVMELVDMRDLGSRAAMRVGSSPFRRTKKKDMTFGHVFLFGFRPPEAASTLWDFNARGGKAAPAPRFSPAAKTLVRRTRAAGQKAGCV